MAPDPALVLDLRIVGTPSASSPALAAASGAGDHERQCDWDFPRWINVQRVRHMVTDSHIYCTGQGSDLSFSTNFSIGFRVNPELDDSDELLPLLPVAVFAARPPFAIELAKTAIELVRQCSSCREMLPLNGGHFVTDYHFNFGSGE